MTTKKAITTHRPVQSKPCGECPFRRTSAPGWLGAESPEGFVESIMREAPLPCHTTIDYEKPDWKAQWDARRIGRMCAGAAIFTANCAKLPRSPLIPVGKCDTTLVFASPREFIEHHRSLGVGSWGAGRRRGLKP